MNGCETFRERIHGIYDGDGPAELPDALREHLALCPSCRETFDDYAALRALLRGLPAEALPPETLDAVWKRTVRKPGGGAHAGAWWRAAAAAVVATGLIATSYLLTRPVAEAPSESEIASAEAQADLVLGYAARALDATRAVTANRVFAREISPAVRGSAVAHETGRRDEP